MKADLRLRTSVAVSLALLAGIATLSRPAHADDCVYDITEQRRHVARIAASLSSTTTSEDGRELTWREHGRAYRLRYGGCHHLGLQVSVTWTADALPADDTLNAMAIELATRLFAAHEASRLRAALIATPLSRDPQSGDVRYHHTSPEETQFAIEARHADGAVSLVVMWMTNV